MSWMNLVPGLSQLKAAVELVTGDVEAAEQTTRDFYTKCPGVSHVVGTGVGVVGILADIDDCKNFAAEAIEGGTRTVSDVLDIIPVVGEAKGVVHLLLGDKEGAKRAFKASSVSSLVGLLAGDLDKKFGRRRNILFGDVLELLDDGDAAVIEELRKKCAISLRDAAARERTRFELLRRLESKRRNFEEAFQEGLLTTERESQQTSAATPTANIKAKDELINQLENDRKKINECFDNAARKIEEEFRS